MKQESGYMILFKLSMLAAGMLISLYATGLYIVWLIMAIGNG